MLERKELVMRTIVNNFKIFFCLLATLTTPCATRAKLVEYKLAINTKQVTYKNKQVTALAINNQIPAPTIEVTVGDTLRVTFENKSNEASSIHWHGVLLPNDQDGVPYLTTPPIRAHSSFTYQFPIKHAGTYWYHSHTHLQEQRGMYGALIFHPADGETVKTDLDYVVVLSDWTNEKPSNVLANLKKDGDYYALKKDSVQSWDKVIQNGWPAIKNRLKGAWSRMGPMDISDIGYDAFLANGKTIETLDAQPGQTIRIRLINSAASSYFKVEFAGGPMEILSADGVDVQPFKVKRLLIAIAETYDLLIKIPDNKAYELRATAEDGTGHSSTFVGSGTRVFAPDIPRPNLFLITHDHAMHKSSGSHTKHKQKAAHKHKPKHMTHASMVHASMKHHDKQHKPMHMKHASMKHDAQPVIEYMNNYQALRATQSTSLPAGRPKRKITIKLTGNMERYSWSFNNKTLLESNKIMIKKGENVTFVLVNKTMMHHPIHLHGHFFRVLNGQGTHSPLKHTVNVPAMGEATIEFEANNEKDWFFHCHNLYHMKTGMARSISYEKTTTATPETFKKLAPEIWYFLLDTSALSNMTMGMFRASNTRNAFVVNYDYDYNKDYDVDIIYKRNFTRYFDAYIGANLEHEGAKTENTGIIGINYVLPLLIQTDLRLDTDGNVRLELKSKLQLTKRIHFDWSVNTDEEYRFTLSYEWNKNFLLTAAYDSNFKAGAGIRFIF